MQGFVYLDAFADVGETEAMLLYKAKVSIAAVRREPVAHIGEGSDHAVRRRPSPGPYGQSLAALQVESLHPFRRLHCRSRYPSPP